MKLHHLLIAAVAASALASTLGCSATPPASQLPNAQAAIDRMRATTACGNAVQANDVKIDQFSKQGRIRATISLFAERPDHLRIGVFAPVVNTLIAELATDGARFQLKDDRESKFYTGPASACNIARLTGVPIPGRVLVSLLRGQAPVVRHDAAGLAPPTIEWHGGGGGYYVVKIAGTRSTVQELHLVPRPDDFAKPWAEQRMRVLDVSVSQQGVLIYHAELDGHVVAKMATETPPTPEDIALGQTPSPLSGPMCDAEIPTRIHVDVPSLEEDVLFRYDTVLWNPPLPEGKFVLPPPQGLSAEEVTCEE
ncbi:hypothetical protein BH09MYX1_BH09MYX1_55970 [soil metagenome]